MHKLLAVVAALVLSLTSVIISSHADARSFRWVASYYASGRIMANGGGFNKNDPHLAAHRSLPFCSTVLLENPKTGKSLLVKITDRGPFVRGRTIDVTLAGARDLGFVHDGFATLNATVVHKASANEKCGPVAPKRAVRIAQR